MRLIILLAVTLMGTMSIKAQEIQALWNTGKQNTIVNMIAVENYFEGKIHSSDNSQAPIGKIIVKDLTEISNSIYKGKIYVAKKKKWYNAKFVPKDNELIITVSAGFIKKTITWKKA